jgi:ABC-type uncharacterized transport system involved in gliding motility auxiliary subunit
VGIITALFGLVLLAFAIVALVAGAHPSWIYGHLGLGALLLIYSAATSFGDLRALLGGDAARRSARYGGNAAAQTAIVAVILGLVAYLSMRHPVHWDWTQSGLHSLAEATQEVLRQIPEDQPVEVLAFFQPGSEQGVRRILDRYAYAAERFRFRIVDPNRHPTLATRHEIRTNGVLVVCGGDCDSATGTARVIEASEQEITRAVRSVISKRNKVYFVIGHGEGSPDDEEAAGLSRVRDALKDENIEAAPLFLAREPEVPEDASALIVAGAERPLQGRELEILDRYLLAGGSVAVFIDPFVRTNLADQLLSWGVEIGDDIIVDQQVQLFAGPKLGVQPIVMSYGNHPITQKLNGNPTLFHIARSVRKGEGAEEGEFVELASTGPASWAETNTELFLTESRVGREGTDRAGPVAVAAARSFKAADDERGGRLVVVGDSDFARNRYVSEFFNSDLVMNIANWLTGEESFITIDRPLPRASRVAMTPDQFNNFRYLSLFVLPEAILLWGILLWWRRRT